MADIRRGLGATAGANYTDGWNNSSPWGPDMTLPGAYGAFCYCANNSGWGHCQSPRRTPEQINVQLSGPTSVVVAFVTFGDVDVRDGGAPPPVAQFWPAGSIPSSPSSGDTVAGVSTSYDTDALCAAPPS